MFFSAVLLRTARYKVFIVYVLNTDSHNLSFGALTIHTVEDSADKDVATL